MSEKDKPAFPHHEVFTNRLVDQRGVVTQENKAHNGMTLHDYYVGQAIIGLLANPGAQGEYIKEGRQIFDKYAKSARLFADAIIAAKDGVA